MHNHWNSEKKSISKINADVVLLMLVKMQLTSSAATTIGLSIYFSKRLNQQTWTRITCVCTHTWLILHGRRQLNYWQVVKSYWNFDLCFSKFIFLTASALISILNLWSLKHCVDGTALFKVSCQYKLLSVVYHGQNFLVESMNVLMQYNKHSWELHCLPLYNTRFVAAYRWKFFYSFNMFWL